MPSLGELAELGSAASGLAAIVAIGWGVRESRRQARFHARSEYSNSYQDYLAKAGELIVAAHNVRVSAEDLPDLEDVRLRIELFCQAAMVIDEYGRAAGRMFLAHRPIVLNHLIEIFPSLTTAYMISQSELLSSKDDHHRHWRARDAVFDLVALGHSLDDAARHYLRVHSSKLDVLTLKIVRDFRGSLDEMLAKTKTLYFERFGEVLQPTSTSRM